MTYLSWDKRLANLAEPCSFIGCGKWSHLLSPYWAVGLTTFDGCKPKAMTAFISGEMKDTVEINPAGSYGTFGFHPVLDDSS